MFKRAKRRGFFVLDSLIGLILLAAMMTALAVAITRQNKASARLSESRAALAAAEAAMAALQDSSGAKPQAANSDNVNVEIVEVNASAPKGLRWIEVRADCHGRRARLVGLVAGGER